MKRLSLYERARLAAERVPHMPHKWSSERIHWRLGWMAGWLAAKREMKKRRR